MHVGRYMRMYVCITHPLLFIACYSGESAVCCGEELCWDWEAHSPGHQEQDTGIHKHECNKQVCMYVYVWDFPLYYTIAMYRCICIGRWGFVHITQYMCSFVQSMYVQSTCTGWTPWKHCKYTDVRAYLLALEICMVYIRTYESSKQSVSI